MKAEDRILKRYGRDTGMSVPDGYFEQVFAKISQELPEMPVAPPRQRVTMWQRVRPYIYMAAMFAGIWLMMKVFVNVGNRTQLNLENPPQEIALAMAEYEGAMPDVGEDETAIDINLMEEAGSEYDNIEEFEAAFESDPEFALEPKYENIDVDAVMKKGRVI